MSKVGRFQLLILGVLALGAFFVVGTFLWDGGPVALGWGVGLIALGLGLSRFRKKAGAR